MSRDTQIFYYCYDHSRPTGGEKHSYQHVDVLNANGYRAFVYHRSGGMRLSWFENKTAIIDQQGFDSCYEPERDILVFPEDLGDRMLAYPGRRVIFNKNVYYGFRALGFEQSDPYTDERTLACLTVSESNREVLCAAYPTLACYRVVAHIRQDIFTAKPLHEKRLRVVSAKKARTLLATLYRVVTGSTKHRPPWE